MGSQAVHDAFVVAPPYIVVQIAIKQWAVAKKQTAWQHDRSYGGHGPVTLTYQVIGPHYAHAATAQSNAQAHLLEAE